jgi:LuxR family maltose regulon positive regulatory protein
MRLVLSARYDPPLRLRRLAVAGAVTEIRARDLAFNEDEVAELLAGRRLPLPDWAVLDRTRGWAAGLRLGRDRLGPERPAGARSGQRCDP